MRTDPTVTVDTVDTGTTHPIRSAILALLVGLSMLLTACGAGNADPGNADPDDADTAAAAADSDGSDDPDDAGGSDTPNEPAAFPRTVDLPDGSRVEIASEPEKVAALSGDAAEALAALVGSDRLIAVPQTVTDPAASNHADELASVEHILPPGADPDPEAVLAIGPDLVVLTARHQGEQDAFDLLLDSGIPVIAFENNWESFDQIAENVGLLGAALGVPDRAEDLIAEMYEQVDTVEQAVADVAEKPSVLVLLSPGADNPMILGSSSISTHLVTAAGGELAAERIGITTTVRADPEQVVNADPDVIVLIDRGTRGIEDYASILDNPAVAQLDAVATDRVLVLPATEASATAGLATAGGLRTLAEYLHPDRF